MPQVAPAIETFARIKVVGVGGAGGAAVNRMIEAGVDGVEFIVINTDAQALHHSKAPVKIHIGKDETRGLGAGANPAVGQKAAEELIAEKHRLTLEPDDEDAAVQGAVAALDLPAMGGGSRESVSRVRVVRVGEAAPARMVVELFVTGNCVRCDRPTL